MVKSAQGNFFVIFWFWDLQEIDTNKSYKPCLLCESRRESKIAGEQLDDAIWDRTKELIRHAVHTLMKEFDVNQDVALQSINSGAGITELGMKAGRGHRLPPCGAINDGAACRMPPESLAELRILSVLFRWELRWRRIHLDRSLASTPG